MSENKLLILNFHSIFRSETKELYHYDPVFSISEEKLIRCFELLKQNNVACGSWKNLIEGRAPVKNEVYISFDDGHISDYEIALPLLKKYGLDACFFIVAENLIKNPLDKQRIIDLSKQGFSIGSHGLSHRKMTYLTEKDQHFEFKESKSILENCIEKKINFFAFPNGRCNSSLIELGKQTGYSILFTTQAKWNKATSNSFIFDRWSIKQNTSLSQIEKVLTGRKFASHKLKYSSIIKSYLLKISDKINT